MSTLTCINIELFGFETMRLLSDINDQYGQIKKIICYRIILRDKPAVYREKITLIEAILGYRPKTDWKTGLSRTVAAYRHYKETGNSGLCKDSQFSGSQ